MKSDALYGRIGAILPEKLRERLQDRINKAGVVEEAGAWFGKRLAVTCAVGAAFSVLPVLLSIAKVKALIFDFSAMPTVMIAALVLMFFVCGIAIAFSMFYLLMYYVIVDRSERVEKILPEFLLMVASNLRAGMTPFNAFRRSATPELGPLEKEIQLAAVKASASQSLTNALASLSDRIDSEVLQKTVDLFDKSVRSGGQIAELLTAIAEEVRRNQELKAELVTTTKSYTIFLFFIIVIIMPALLAVSSQFLQVYANIRSQTSSGGLEGYALPFFVGNIQISTDFAAFVAYLSLFGTSLFSSLLMGVISRGRPFYGIKYFPLLALGAFICYGISLGVAGSIFGAF